MTLAATAMLARLEIGDNMLVLGLALIPAIPAWIAAVVSIRGRNEVNKELQKNGGESMNDKLSAVHRKVVAHDRAEDPDAEPIVTVATVDKA